MSHFSFTRTSSDQCALNQSLHESTESFRYMTDNIKENKASCFLDQTPFMHNQFNSIPAYIVDYESDLNGHGRLNSKCNSRKYNPELKKPIDFSWRICEDKKLLPEYTRVNKSCNIFSGMSINRFYPLHENVQDFKKIYYNQYTGINTRNLIKDSFQREKK